MPRPLYEIANEIEKDWGKKVSLNSSGFNAAKPYIRAMKSLNGRYDNYGEETGFSIIRYFLANAGTWRGENARRIKTELKLMLKEG